ncbi:MAG: CoA pyrophosphatase [Spirochaetales bacterium]|nr:CoA pyrophosphatase [Spirochaetales bacterium]
MTLERALGILGDPARPLPGDAARAAMLPPFRRESPPEFAGAPWRRAAVLVVLHSPDGLGASFPLIERPEGQGVHSGQVSLPGGALEPGESAEACALRETFEELGVDPGSVRVVRALTSLGVPPSRFEIQPFVGVARAEPAFRPNPAEVAAVFEVALADLLDARACATFEMPGEDRAWSVPCFEFNGHRVWGATAMILAELAVLLRERGGFPSTYPHGQMDWKE